MACKLEIQWTPLKNKFITWGTDNIYLYEVKSLQETSSHVIKISNTHCADVFACTSNQHYVKTLDIHPKSERDILLAIGLCNGKVSLSTFGFSEWEAKGLPGKELSPRHARQCNAVLFNPNESNLLAVGLDKYKPDTCILIWDINQMSSHDNNSSNFAQNNADIVRPICELGSSESCQSLAWFHGNSRILAAGMNWKNIKLFDIRDHQKMISSNLAKAAHGVSTNPRDDRYLASFADSQMFVWDTRNIEKPVLVLPHSKPLLKIGWSPTKNNLLCSLQRESNILNLYDIQHPIVGNEEVEPTVLERTINPGMSSHVSSFSWHPNEENRILTIANSGTIIDYTVFDRITLNWSPVSEIAWSCGRRTIKYINNVKISQNIQDISSKMQQRAKIKYGLEDELYKNAKMVENDEILSNVWNWLHLSTKLVEDGKIYGSHYRHPGVLSILKLDSDTNPSETITITWAELGHPNCAGAARYYKREDRNKALQLCSWPVERDSQNLTTFIENLGREKAYTRAAAIAVFNLKVQLAIDVLSKAPNNTEYGSILNVVAMALSGFSDDPNSAWKTFCATSSTKLTDPYLKVMFAFLTAENYNYDSVLNESGITIDDRVAFACMFLPDNKLNEYIRRLCDNLCMHGNLDGLLLTGNSSQGLKLLQKYLDFSGDIQSTALIAVRAFRNELSNQTIKDWIENYQLLLNTWRFWFERAEFDLMVLKYKNEKPPQQIYISCSYCGKSISSHFKLKITEQYSRMTGTGTQNKLSACPNCRKPMPRCTICLMNMGTTIGDSNTTKPTDFDNWFTWCQHCRHGGHSKHMIRWFEDHLECPTTGCTCRCFSLDYIISRCK